MVNLIKSIWLFLILPRMQNRYGGNFDVWRIGLSPAV